MSAGGGAYLSAQCSDGSAPPDAWICPASHTVSCNAGEGAVAVDTLYVPAAGAGDPDAGTCGPLQVSNAGPYPPGTHLIDVTDHDGSTVCSAALTVVDDEAPTVLGHHHNLWPPNHKFYTISVADCVTMLDNCDTDLRAEFVWATSDEPEDAMGDGHHRPDIVFDDCQHVAVRAERQGPGDGRVYRLGVRVFDDAGHSAESECTILVDHDQRGVPATDSGEAYRIEAADAEGRVCGSHAPPPVSDGGVTMPESDAGPAVPDEEDTDGPDHEDAEDGEPGGDRDAGVPVENVGLQGPS